MTSANTGLIDLLVGYVKQGTQTRQQVSPLIRQYGGDPDVLFAQQEAPAIDYDIRALVKTNVILQQSVKCSFVVVCHDDFSEADFSRAARIQFDGRVTKSGLSVFLDCLSDREFDIAKKNENLDLEAVQSNS